MPKIKTTIKSAEYRPAEIAGLTSRVFRPEMCCNACVFGEEQHAPWCPEARKIKRVDRWKFPNDVNS